LQGRSFSGQVARMSGAIDTATRTMQVEITLPNKDAALMPGAFVQVALALAPSGAMSIPANALIFRAEGTRVAAVDAAGKIHLQDVRVGRNFGETVEVLEGLKGTEKLVLNPSDSLAEGDKVQLVAAGSPAPGAKAVP
jgi:RND family efflux transporter MFP subunit